jgi:hypothetical protein
MRNPTFKLAPSRPLVKPAHGDSLKADLRSFASVSNPHPHTLSRGPIFVRLRKLANGDTRKMNFADAWCSQLFARTELPPLGTKERAAVRAAWAIVRRSVTLVVENLRAEVRAGLRTENEGTN